MRAQQRASVDPAERRQALNDEAYRSVFRVLFTRNHAVSTAIRGSRATAHLRSRSDVSARLEPCAHFRRPDACSLPISSLGSTIRTPRPGQSAKAGVSAHLRFCTYRHRHADGCSVYCAPGLAEVYDAPSEATPAAQHRTGEA